MDLLGINIDNSFENIKGVFKDVLREDSINDGLVFLIDTLTVEKIAEQAKYNGIRVKVRVLLGKATNNLSIDIGFGDVVIPKPQKIEYPVLLETEPAPIITTYTIDSIIAEKFHAMINRLLDNSRMKDFYDIYSLSKNNDFKGIDLRKAILETFENRSTDFKKDTILFKKEFAKDEEKNVQWEAFINRIKSDKVNFEEVMKQIGKFLNPLYESLINSTLYNNNWDHAKNDWI